ncbi:AAA family ATPase [Streptomyces sp. NPDC002328]|uniref:AAA family ATPase n=1 Tax=Streptomyces sp. NPDC002328 TaxID=3364642 RepID=UPI0036A4C7B2
MNASPASAEPLYRGTGVPLLDDVPYEERAWPAGPPWRTFTTPPAMPAPPDDDESERRLGSTRIHRLARPDEVRLVNAALLLRRPLLVTGRPGVGKSGLAFLIARELRLGRVLQWAVTSRTTLGSGLFEYDAVGRAQALHSRARDDEPTGTGDFVQLGPLGTALLPYRLPRVLLIDEIDKCDIDLPNDLLTLFEDGYYAIPPLIRVKAKEPTVTVHTADPGGRAEVTGGVVGCHVFPVIVMTSNGEREFPEAFMRRCLRMDLPEPDAAALGEMVAAHFGDRLGPREEQLIHQFLRRSDRVGGLAADQLLNAVHLVTSGHYPRASTGESGEAEWADLLESIWHPLGGEGTEPA